MAIYNDQVEYEQALASWLQDRADIRATTEEASAQMENARGLVEQSRRACAEAGEVYARIMAVPMPTYEPAE